MRLLFGSSTSCCNGKHDITLTERIVRNRGLGHLLCLGSGSRPNRNLVEDGLALRAVAVPSTVSSPVTCMPPFRISLCVAQLVCSRSVDKREIVGRCCVVVFSPPEVTQNESQGMSLVSTLVGVMTLDTEFSAKLIASQPSLTKKKVRVRCRDRRCWLGRRYNEASVEWSLIHYEYQARMVTADPLERP